MHYLLMLLLKAFAHAFCRGVVLYHLGGWDDEAANILFPRTKDLSHGDPNVEPLLRHTHYKCMTATRMYTDGSSTREYKITPVTGDNWLYRLLRIVPAPLPRRGGTGFHRIDSVYEVIAIHIWLIYGTRTAVLVQ